jgi:glycerate kinase
MRFLIAPDKFKGSLSALDVAEQIANGIRDVLPAAEIEIAPIADGGEGTAEVICRARGGEWISCAAHDPFGQLITARYVWLSDSNTALVEMSEVAGMHRALQRDPLRANTFGVGEMLLDGARRGAQKIVVGLGGSATNDGGFGMARALGFRFLAEETELANGPEELVNLTRIVPPNELQLPHIVAAADVRNPLLGERGATRVFGPQKGAGSDALVLLERALTRLADVVAHDLGCDFREQPGAGAAGGLGFGLMSFCGAEFCPGFDVVAEAIQLADKIRNADVVITGEGRLDAQTLEGKGPARVAELARASNKQSCAIVGEADESATTMFDHVVTLARPPMTRTMGIKLASELLRERAQEMARFYLSSKLAK